MIAKQYSVVAEIYPFIMRKIDYGAWANYISDLAEFSSLNVKLALEIAGGNGALANKLNGKFQNIILTDLSLAMLKKNNNEKLSKVCCDMRSLPFSKKFDFIYSAFDSVNYLMTKEELRKFFLEVKKILAADGVFTFDVGLEKNSLKHLRFLNRSGEVNGIKFQQISKFDKRKKIHLNRFLFDFPDGRKIEEVHRQRIYSLTEIFEVLDGAGFFVAECFEAFTFKDVNSKTERAQFLIIHNKDYADN